jgi:ATP-dependent DNA helicase RecQ
MEGFLNQLSQCKLSLFAIDETHCVSQWSYDLWPEHLKFCALKDRFANISRLALTATADGPTRKDIIERLDLK